MRVDAVGGAFIGKDRPLAALAERNLVAVSVDHGQIERGRLDAIIAMFVEAAGELEQPLPHIGHGERCIVSSADAYPQFPGCESLTLHPFIVSPMKAALQIARRPMVRIAAALPPRKNGGLKPPPRLRAVP